MNYDLHASETRDQGFAIACQSESLQHSSSEQAAWALTWLLGCCVTAIDTSLMGAGGAIAVFSYLPCIDRCGYRGAKQRSMRMIKPGFCHAVLGHRNAGCSNQSMVQPPP